MTLTPGLRKLVRTAHVTFTVGWLGAVAGFLVLAITGLTSRDARIISAVYPAMALITRFIIIPFSLVPLLITGPLLSLGTPWGLFRHYWILAKLLINILSTFLLQLHLPLINYLSDVAAAGTLSSADFGIQRQMVIISGAALVVLLVATGLSIFKPRGLTPYGRRKQQEKVLQPH
jgi:hypothetical protein